MKRNQQTYIEQLLKDYPVVAILGARQCGKTTLAKEMRPEWRYIDLERPSHLEEIRDLEHFFLHYSQSVIFDEAQRFPLLFEVLRSVIDEQRAMNGRFILTGSSSSELIKNISESLAGRIAIVELGTVKANEVAGKPLSVFYELLKQGLKKPDLCQFDENPLPYEVIQQAWLYGGYPQPILNGSPAFIHQWYDQYEQTYVYRDLSFLFPKLNKTAYQRFIRILAHLSGTIINKSQLGRDIEVSESSIRDYLEIIEGTFLWRNLLSFEGSRPKSMVKMPRGHLRDSGLLHYLLKIQNKEGLLSHPIIGRSFEGFAIEELLKGISCAGIINVDAFYYRTRNGAEIDLILDGPFGLLPIEIKYGVYTPRKALQTLHSFIAEYNLPFGVLINQGERITWLTPHILQIPIRFI